MSVTGVYASGVGGAGGECGVYRSNVYGVAFHPQLHAPAWLPYAALLPPAHHAPHAPHPAHPAHPQHLPIDTVPSQYVSDQLFLYVTCYLHSHRGHPDQINRDPGILFDNCF